MKSYKELKQIFSRIHDLKKTLDTIFFCAELSCADMQNKISQIATIKSIIYEIITSTEILDLLNEVDCKDLDHDYDKRNYDLMKSFVSRVSQIPVELSIELTQKSLLCKSSFLKAKAQNNFEIVYPDFISMLNALQKIIDIKKQGSKKSAYDLLLESSNQIDIKEIDEICISVGPFLKSKVQKIHNQNNKQANPSKINSKKITEKFLPSDACHISNGSSNCIFDTGIPLNIIMQSKSLDAMPYLMHNIGKAAYHFYLPHQKYHGQPICSPASISMYSAQGFLFSHFLLEEKCASKIFGYTKSKSFQQSAMSANKFVALTHFIVNFSLERSLINQEVDPKNLETLFKEDMSYYFDLDGESVSIFENDLWFSGQFCQYPCYVKGMAIAGQIFHSIKSDESIWNSSRPKLAKIVEYLADGIYSAGASKSTGKIIQELTGEKLDCRFFKKSE